MSVPTTTRRKIFSGFAVLLILCAVALPFVLYYFAKPRTLDNDLIISTERPLPAGLAHRSGQDASDTVDDGTPQVNTARRADSSASVPGEVTFSVIVLDLGLDETAADQIRSLPHELALALSPYAEFSPELLSRRDIYIDVPLEPYNYPANDPGPHTLKVSASPFENLARLGWILGRFSDVKGVFTRSGTFSSQRDLHDAFLQNISAREWQLVEAGKSHFKPTAPDHNVHYRDVQLILDETAFAGSQSDAILDTIAGLAALGPVVVGIVASPVNINGISDLLDASAERGYRLSRMSG